MEVEEISQGSPYDRVTVQQQKTLVLRFGVCQKFLNGGKGVGKFLYGEKLERVGVISMGSHKLRVQIGPHTLVLFSDNNYNLCIDYIVLAIS